MTARNDSMIERVVRVLDAFDSDEPLTAAEVARRTGLPVPTTHRIVGELVRVGLLERDGQRQLRVGYRLWELATRSSKALGIREIAVPYMEDLQAVVRQHTQLSVLDRQDVLIIERLSSRQTSATNVAPPATRLPALACAPGLVFAAFGDPETRERIITEGKVARFTSASIVDRDVLRDLIAKARNEGFAVASGWIHADTAGIAVPVLGLDGTAVAALSITGPLELAEDMSIVPALRATARTLSRAVRSGGKGADSRNTLLQRRIRRTVESP